MFDDLTLYQLILLVIALIITSPVLVAAAAAIGIVLLVLVFFVFIAAVTAIGGLCLVAAGAAVYAFEAIGRAWKWAKRLFQKTIGPK